MCTCVHACVCMCVCPLVCAYMCMCMYGVSEPLIVWFLPLSCSRFEHELQTLYYAPASCHPLHIHVTSPFSSSQLSKLLRPSRHSVIMHTSLLSASVCFLSSSSHNPPSPMHLLPPHTGGRIHLALSGKSLSVTPFPPPSSSQSREPTQPVFTRNQEPYLVLLSHPDPLHPISPKSRVS